MTESHDVFAHLWNFPDAAREARPGYALAVGPAGAGSWTLSALTAGLAAGERVLWVDASNRFDLYGLARAARERGADADAVLSRVDLARPFTAFQLEKLVSSVIPALPHRRPAVISDPLALFYDPDLPLDDAQRLFKAFLSSLARLERPALVLALERRPPAERAGFSRLLRARANAAAFLSEPERPAALTGPQAVR